MYVVQPPYNAAFEVRETTTVIFPTARYGENYLIYILPQKQILETSGRPVWAFNCQCR